MGSCQQRDEQRITSKYLSSLNVRPTIDYTIKNLVVNDHNETIADVSSIKSVQKNKDEIYQPPNQRNTKESSHNDETSKDEVINYDNFEFDWDKVNFNTPVQQRKLVSRQTSIKNNRQRHSSNFTNKRI